MYPYTLWQTIRSLLFCGLFFVGAYSMLRSVDTVFGFLVFLLVGALLVLLTNLFGFLLQRFGGRMSYRIVGGLPRMFVFMALYVGPTLLLLSRPFPRRHAYYHIWIGYTHIGDQIGANPKRFALAIEHGTRAAALYTRLNDELNLAATLIFIAEQQLRNPIGDLEIHVERAIDHTTRALRMNRYTEHPLLHAHALDMLGIGLMRRGEHSQAIRAIQRALALINPQRGPLAPLPPTLNSALKPRDPEVVQAMIAFHLGLLYLEQTDHQATRDDAQTSRYIEQSLQILSDRRYPADWADIHNNLAMAYSRRSEGDPHENARMGVEFGRRALAIWQRERFPRRWAEAIDNLGLNYERLAIGGVAGALEQAIDCYRQSLEVATPELFPAECRATAVRLGWLYAYQDNYRAAREALELAHRAARLLRANLQRNEVKVAFAAQQGDMYTLLVDCCLRDNDIDAAFTYAAAAKARAFVDSLASTRVSLADLGRQRPEIAQQLERIEQLRKQADSLLIEIEQGGAGAGRLLDRLREVQAREQEAWAQIARSHPEITATQHAPEFSAAEARDIAARLRATLIEYVYRRGDSWGAFVVTAQAIRFVPLPAVDSDLLRLLDEWRAETIRPDRQKDLPYLRRWTPGTWYQALIAPLQLAPADTTQLVIAPAGALHQLPFAAAYNEATTSYLIDEYPITMIPSLSAVAVALRQQQTLRLSGPRSPAQPPALLSVAFAGDDPQSERFLTYAYEEARTIVRGRPHQVLIDRDATPENLIRMAAGSGLLHIACHGWFDQSRPEQSGLILSGGMLTVGQIITQLNLQHVALVTLSACDSGRSRVALGEEPIGLAQAILSTGAQRVIASLWPVNDRATARLFTLFYEQLGLGLTPTLALQAAIRSLRNDQHFDSPYFWAAFHLQGLPMTA